VTTEEIKDPLGDFRVFLYVVWKFLGLPDPTPVQYDIAQYLQRIYHRKGPRRAIIQAFRGVGKTWITVAFVCWALYCNPQLKILVVSASKLHADNFTTFAMRLILELPELQHLKPTDDQRNSKVSFDVAQATADHSPSVKSVGITGQLTGSRADIIVVDDVEVPNNSATQVMRDKLAESVKEFDAILKPDGIVIYLGTPQTEMSLYNVLTERGYAIRIWPARYPEPELVSFYGHRLAPRIIKALEENAKLAGKPTDPKRFSDFDLLEREASYGRSGFQLQFMLNTRLLDAERYPLKLHDLIVMDLNPEMAPEKVIWANGPLQIINELPCVGLGDDRYYSPMALVGSWIPYSGSVMAIDPAGRGKDETAYAVVKILNSQLFLLESGGFSGGYSEDTLEKLAQIAKRQQVNRVLIEANFGDGMFEQLLKPFLTRIYPVTTEEVKHSIQKEKRIIDTLEPVMNQHRLIVDRNLIERDYKSTQHLPSEQALKYQLFYQMSRITRERGALAQDDRLDALAIAVGYWVESMARDVDKAMSDERERQIESALQSFMEHVLGGKPKEQRWMDV
jgi:Holliday junction resolvasome RuvABC endonuclease subunit